MRALVSLHTILNNVCWTCSWSDAEKEDGGTAHGRQRTDSTHVLAKIRALNRMLCVGQSMVYVLNVLSEVAPEWVRAFVPSEWVERYGERLEHERLPKEEKERKQYANQVGADGWTLLDALDAPSTADWLKTLPAILTLRTSLPTAVRAKRARWVMANRTCSPSCSTHQFSV